MTNMQTHLSASEKTSPDSSSASSPTQESEVKIPSKRELPDDDDEDALEHDIPKNEKRAGRRKIKIEYIDDKSRRHITFSKRKHGIMKKAYELSTLTGTQVLLLVVSETGLVYTFTTPKLQPLVTKPEGKNLIQACLNSPDPPSSHDNPSPPRAPSMSNIYTPTESSPRMDANGDVVDDRKPMTPNPQLQAYSAMASMNNYGHHQNAYSSMNPQMPLGSPATGSSSGLSTPNYMSNAGSPYSSYGHPSHLGSYVPPVNQPTPHNQFGNSSLPQQNYWGNPGMSNVSLGSPNSKMNHTSHSQGYSSLADKK